MTVWFLAFHAQPDGRVWNDMLKSQIQLKFGLYAPALTAQELEVCVYIDTGSDMKLKRQR